MFAGARQDKPDDEILYNCYFCHFRPTLTKGHST